MLPTPKNLACRPVLPTGRLEFLETLVRKLARGMFKIGEFKVRSAKYGTYATSKPSGQNETVRLKIISFCEALPKDETSRFGKAITFDREHP